jgi:hypothetical protein
MCFILAIIVARHDIVVQAPLQGLSPARPDA